MQEVFLVQMIGELFGFFCRDHRKLLDLVGFDIGLRFYQSEKCESWPNYPKSSIPYLPKYSGSFRVVLFQNNLLH